jgi:hypothetical protein
MNYVSNQLSGTPTATGTYTFSLKVADASGLTATTGNIVVKIDAAPANSINQWVAPVGRTGIGGMVANPGIETNTVVTTAQITVSNMTPTSGASGATVTVTFSSAPSGVTGVTFNSGLDSASGISLSGSTLTFLVPPNEQGITDQFAITLTGGVIVMTGTFTGT